ncbi:hypothetical protein P692DRAFT_20879193 [Suillus brevipes Sb2]|nr:hypothetical protein P692DRAFT_20879193 [Suillus brevipes Sb2]
MLRQYSCNAGLLVVRRAALGGPFGEPDDMNMPSDLDFMDLAGVVVEISVEVSLVDRYTEVLARTLGQALEKMHDVISACGTHSCIGKRICYVYSLIPSTGPSTSWVVPYCAFDTSYNSFGRSPAVLSDIFAHSYDAINSVDPALTTHYSRQGVLVTDSQDNTMHADPIRSHRPPSLKPVLTPTLAGNHGRSEPTMEVPHDPEASLGTPSPTITIILVLCTELHNFLMALSLVLINISPLPINNTPVKRTKKPLTRRIAMPEFGIFATPVTEIPQTPVPPYHQTPAPVTVSQNYMYRLVLDR